MMNVDNAKRAAAQWFHRLQHHDGMSYRVDIAAVFSVSLFSSYNQQVCECAYHVPHMQN
jgi:hypothetical protein